MGHDRAHGEVSGCSDFHCLSNPTTVVGCSVERRCLIDALSPGEAGSLRDYAPVLANDSVVELQTAGGGACAIHAAFGTPCGRHGETIAHSDPRGLVSQLVCHLLHSIRLSLTAQGNVLLTQMLTKLWTDVYFVLCNTIGNFVRFGFACW